MLKTEITQLIERALKGLRYGSVQIVVHDGKLIRIERLDRIRLPANSQEVEPTGFTGGSFIESA